MTFIENLLKKIEIDQMARTVRGSLGTYESGAKLDLETMKKLLHNTAFKPMELRNLELFVLKTGEEKNEILVLDNDLPIYHTTPDDVALRKSPTIKEMVSIRNAVKILRDTDVLVSKKEVSLWRVQKECLETLDLSFTRQDIEAIEQDGISSLERDYLDGIREALTLYAEILDLKPVPKKFQMLHHDIWGQIETPENGRVRITSVVLYNLMQNKLKLYAGEIKGTLQEVTQSLKALSDGKQKASHEGSEVFIALSRMVRDRFGDKNILPVSALSSA
ncbi:MAG: hypothetical protein FP816_15575 [Desulfobacteraceae bacterium]|nr:hypothetical protein [Desulfobacteraceae bacterium]MBU4002859.1 hypothetical protein [Pseudomonadota bacterium]MBU4055127.1 hypothetical protein [Pseudomonadota bacterium]